MPQRHQLIAGLWLLAAIGLAGCAATPSTTTTEPPASAVPSLPSVDVESDDRLVVTGERVGLDALIQGGTFQLVEGCLVLDDAEGTRWVPVLPEGTQLDEGGSLVTPAGAVVPQGVPVDVGGGMRTSGWPDDVEQAPCLGAAEQVWLVRADF